LTNSANPTPRENSTDGFEDLTKITSYSEKGGPRGGPGKGEPTGPPPGNRSSVLANPERQSGAALRIITTSPAQRGQMLRDLGQPVPEQVQDRTGAIVQAYHGGVSPLWRRRQQDAQGS
jgi:hypothetical protein